MIFRPPDISLYCAETILFLHAQIAHRKTGNQLTVGSSQSTGSRQRTALRQAQVKNVAKKRMELSGFGQ
jgi:hypothetical protein